MAHVSDTGKHCVNCKFEFVSSKGKTFRRTGLDSSIKHQGVSPVSVICSAFRPGVKISPSGKFLCEQCTQLLGKISSGQKKVKEAAANFISIGQTDSYLKRKLQVTTTLTPEKERSPHITPLSCGKTTSLGGQICGAKVTPSSRRYW